MKLTDPSRMSDADKQRLSSRLSRASLFCLMGALCCAAAGLIGFLIDSRLIVETPWAIVAGAAAISLLVGIAYGIREYRSL